jgi:hypothetical protein
MNVGERIEVNRIEGGCCEPDMVKSDFLTL